MKRLHPLWGSLLVLALVYALLEWGLRLVGPPLPASLMRMYLALAVAALAFYVTLSNARIAEFLDPVSGLFDGRRSRVVALGALVPLPLLASGLVYRSLTTAAEPPAELRVIHPASPAQIRFAGEALPIAGLENPLRQEPERLAERTREGAVLYFRNCVFCHGPRLDGKGPLARGLNPPPADFTDSGTIAQLQESYLFWRIAKGGRGLPPQSHAWNSAMPVWEERLTAAEIWRIILFLYDGAGVAPRTWE